MDIFNLIRAVRCREPIWNRQHPQYKDRECSLMLWTEVAEETGVDVETARCKWRGLRDTFRVQLRKLNQAIKNGTSNPLTWEYFDEMVFVKDQIYIDINRKKYYTKDRSIGEYVNNKDVHAVGTTPNEEVEKVKNFNNIKEKKPQDLIPTKIDYPIQSAIEQAIRIKMEQPPHQLHDSLKHGVQNATCSRAVSATFCVPAQISVNQADEEMDFQVPANFCVAEVTEDTETRLEFDSDTNDGADTSSRHSDEIEPQIVDQSVSTPVLHKKLKALQDDNYCFLMSILPQMKTLPTKQKLFVRIKIQELLFAEILNMENRD